MYSTTYASAAYQQVTSDPQVKPSTEQSDLVAETTANYFYGNYPQYTHFHTQPSADIYSQHQHNYFVNYYNNQASQQYYSYQPEKQYTPYTPAEYNFNYSTKSATPPPVSVSTNVQYSQVATFAETTTPEKSVNDSGIDLISPQLENKSVSQYSQIAPVQEAVNESDSEESEDEENESPVKSSKCADADVDNAAKPPKPYLEIIADAVLSSKVKMMQLHEIYHVMESKFQYFAKNVNKSWRNSVRHNLSLNECFVKAGRGSNGKGNYWKIHPLCEKEFIRGNFRRKSFKQLIRAGGGRNAAAPQVPFSDYALNYQSMPPTLPSQLMSQFNQGSAPVPSFNYPFLNQQYQQTDLNTAYPSESKRTSTQRYSPY